MRRLFRVAGAFGDHPHAGSAAQAGSAGAAHHPVRLSLHRAPRRHLVQARHGGREPQRPRADREESGDVDLCHGAERVHAAQERQFVHPEVAEARDVPLVEEGGDGTPTLSTLYRGDPDGSGQLEAMPQSLRDTLNDSRTPTGLMLPRRLM